jgi:hypothetical protein
MLYAWGTMRVVLQKGERVWINMGLGYADIDIVNIGTLERVTIGVGTVSLYKTLRYMNYVQPIDRQSSQNLHLKFADRWKTPNLKTPGLMATDAV